jgi:hypothetical protein
VAFFVFSVSVAKQCRKTRIFLLQFAGTYFGTQDHLLQFAGTHFGTQDHLLQFAGVNSVKNQMLKMKNQQIVERKAIVGTLHAAFLQCRGGDGKPESPITGFKNLLWIEMDECIRIGIINY